ncbi:hypothetical protein GS429_14010 [Natronorubrum sp. JWXQ-INN-674]|uniref:DUF8215 domain-containing protein n=1 Tax=Natronorubrum halalkaliphilum TaxID=2691917 RepID=A0A6B0VPS7_9EURY|nr:hypothetical protein [Natronorubrum halalkaliphilum]MXV63163.1 hypothetical protein [Natronorubrum halalkaliphilum]
MRRDSGHERVPGRQTRPAHSATRRTWYGYGKRARVEKSGFGRFLHDCSYVFGDISSLSLPVLFAIMAAPGAGAFDATAAGLLAWTTMVLIGTAIRGGWIRPPATETLGWVAVTPSLVALRLVYYNLALGIAVFGGVAMANAAGIAPLSLIVAFVVAAGSTLAFPRLSQSIYGGLRGT